MPSPDETAPTPDAVTAPQVEPAAAQVLAAVEAVPPVAERPDLPPAPAGKKWVTIVNKCRLTLQDATTRVLPLGTHLLPAEIADHWYVRHHSDDPPPVQHQAGTRAYAVEKTIEEQRQIIINEAAKQLALLMKTT